MSAQVIPLSDTVITARIHFIRGEKVMLDRDLAELYGVETRVLKQAVRRNQERFPADFLFELTFEEGRALTSQVVMLKQGGHTKYRSFAFTEHGILMLANVLRSPEALAMSIQIIRVFTRMRELVLTQKDLLLKVEQLEQAVLTHDKDLDKVFECLKQLLDQPASEPRKQVGYKTAGA